MKNTLSLLTILLPILARPQTTADLRKFKDGVGASFETCYALSNKILRDAGKTHKRFVVRFNTFYPGGGQPPVLTLPNKDKLLRGILEAQSAGLAVILTTEVSAQENAGMFYRNITVDALGKPSMSIVTNFGHWNSGLVETANFLNNPLIKQSWIIWQIPPVEAGSAFRDTGAREIVNAKFPNETTERKTELEALVKIWLPNHPAQRMFSTQIWEAAQDHFIRTIRNTWTGTIMIGTPGYNSPSGPGVYQDCNPVRFPNTLFAIHAYGPREVSHDGDGNRPYRNVPYPATTEQWKILFPESSWTGINYEWDGREWNYNGQLDCFSDLNNWRIQFPSIYNFVHVAEYGCTASKRNTVAGRNLIADQRRAIDVFGFGKTEWIN